MNRPLRRHKQKTEQVCTCSVMLFVDHFDSAQPSADFGGVLE